MNLNTIVAPASPPGYGGVSLIRISGPKSKSIVKKITTLNSLENRLSLFTSIQSKGEKIDDVLVCFYKNPNSYTGEDVVEISCHGNPIIVDKIITLILDSGAIMAEPGEFTKRAFINGKMDLVQAESVAKLIESKSIESANLNQKTLSGGLSNKLNEIRQSLITILSELEFEFDISEDELPNPNLLKNAHNLLNNNILSCKQMVESFKEGKLLSSGARVVLCGKPNVGKSTLLNALLQEDRAIVSNVPGTTRDIIESTIILNGIPVVLIDTAGFRQSIDDIETKGIHKTSQEINKADLVINIASPDLQHIDNIDVNKKQLFVFNKIDLITGSKKRDEDFLFVSAKNNIGIQELKQKIITSLVDASKNRENVMLTSRRQLNQIVLCKDFLNKAVSHIVNSNTELELLAHDIRDAISAIDVLLGKTSADDILNNVFSGFCVGK